MAERFSASDLLGAGASFHERQDFASKAWRTYQDNVMNSRGRPQAERLADALDFLGSWQALRFKGGRAKVTQVFPEFVADHSGELENLQNRPLHDLSFRELYTVFQFADELRSSGLPPTCYGKLLHFLLPETVLLWDEAFVRSRYQIGSDPASFLAYQAFGQRLLRHIVDGRGNSILRGIQEEHRPVAERDETICRLVDEVAYREDLVSKALSALGGRRAAFALPTPDD